MNKDIDKLIQLKDDINNYIFDAIYQYEMCNTSLIRTDKIDIYNEILKNVNESVLNFFCDTEYINKIISDVIERNENV